MIIDIPENVLYVYSFFSFYGATYFFYNLIKLLNQKKVPFIDSDSDSDSEESLKREFKLRKRKRKYKYI
jgi:hypothetical protein